MPNLLYRNESHAIIGAAIDVHKTLGRGFLEPVYQEALALEFTRHGIPFRQEAKIQINYRDVLLNKYYIADFICYDAVLLECKAIKHIIPAHEAQVLNYLNASHLQLGLIINFGTTKIEIKRIIKFQQ